MICVHLCSQACRHTYEYGCMDVCGSQQVMFGAFFDCFSPYEGKFCHMSLAHADLPSLTSKLPWGFFVSLSQALALQVGCQACLVFICMLVIQMLLLIFACLSEPPTSSLFPRIWFLFHSWDRQFSTLPLDSPGFRSSFHHCARTWHGFLIASFWWLSSLCWSLFGQNTKQVAEANSENNTGCGKRFCRVSPPYTTCVITNYSVIESNVRGLGHVGEMLGYQ